MNNCHYTISASSSDYRIYELTQGVHKDVKLEPNEFAYFFYKHMFNSSFKIMSLEEYGEVMISANETSKVVMEEFEKLTSINVSKYSWHDNKDVLVVSNTHPGFCYNCYYMIIVKPIAKTQTSLIISNPAVDLPLTIKKQITDTLNTGEFIYYKLFDPRSEFNISLDVYFGEVEITIIGAARNETKNFTMKNATQRWTFVRKDTGNLGRSPIRLRAKGNVVTLYRLSVTSEEELGHHIQMKKGLPTFIYIGK